MIRSKALRLLDRFVIAHELQNVALGIVNIQRPPAAPSMFDRGHLDTQALEAVQLGVEVAFVDLESKVMQRRRLDLNRLAKILRKRDGHGLVEEADDLGVAAMSIRDLQEGDPIELAENVQANYVGVEAL